MGRKGEGEERLERLKNKGLGILDSGSRWTRGGEYRLDESISRVRSRHPVLMPSPVHAILGIGYDAGNDNSCRTVANRDNSKLMIRRENFVVADWRGWMEILSIKFVSSMHKFLIQASNSTIEITFALLLHDYPISAVFFTWYIRSRGIFVLETSQNVQRYISCIFPRSVSIGRKIRFEKSIYLEEKRKVFNTWLEAV